MKRIIIILLTSFMMLGVFSIYAENKHLIFETGEDGKEYWYENGEKQGVYGQAGNVWYDNTERGREIYDPKSDGWYWLDSLYDGAKAVNKEVFMPYIYSNEKDFDANTILDVASKSDTYTEENYIANMSDQVKNAIENKYGKWVRYDENGKMIKGWYKVKGKDKAIYKDQIGNIYYYDFQTGLMAKGRTMIDGKIYEFDEVTGVLKGEWVLVKTDNGEHVNTYEYDAKGNNTKYESYTNSTGERSTFTYEFDEDGNEIKSTYVNSYYTKTTTIEYDENGNITKEFSIFDYNDGTYYEETIIYEYNSDGLVSKKTHNNFNKTEEYEGLSTTYEYFKYDEKGNNIEINTYDMNNALLDTTKYTYDSKGNRIKVEYLFSDEYYTAQNIEYNEINKTVHLLLEDSDGFKYEYTNKFDSNGLLINRITTTDGNTTVQTFEYDANGNITKRKETGQINSITNYEYKYISYE